MLSEWLIEEDEMGGAFGTYGERGNANGILDWEV
jgi:hypothetical protein